MVKVFMITGCGYEPTRLLLPGSQWGFSVRERLTQLGFSVEETNQEPEMTLRSPDELSRMDALLDLSSPY